jgi:deoxyribodipyrimidine photo-lyase
MTRGAAADARCLVWFRNDLRLNDHAALTAAARGGMPIVTCYVHDERAPDAPGGARKWWLHDSLSSLAADIAQRGGQLLLRRGTASVEIAAVAVASAAVEVHCIKSYAPHGRQVEAELANLLGLRGIKLTVHAGDALFDPTQIQSAAGQPFRVFTAFWNACLRSTVPGVPLPVPPRLQLARSSAASESLDAWALTPTSPDWASGFRAVWTPGEAGARARLAAFAAGPLHAYRAERDRPDREGSSRLSPHLSFGEISPRAAWAAAAGRKQGEGEAAFLKELGWREFARHLVWHWPSFPQESFRAEFRRFPWRDDAEALERWRRGQTGYPLVDAGMRELWRTGWMHNRVRMVAASFLVKHLLIPWQQGARWFWDTLVDADVANNSVGWQWVAGSGADAAPYFRVFNPLLQAQKFDLEGNYVRRWVPELAALPTQFLHAPRAAPASVLRAARVEMGRTYPLPVVEHTAARARALAAYASTRVTQSDSER